MLTTIRAGATISLPLDEAVRWCRSGEARLCFPGARGVRSAGGGLGFEVGIRAPGAAPATVTVDEYLKDHGRERGGLWFETSQVWTWPTRECGTSWHLYRLTERPGSTSLEFTWRYILPGLAGAQVFNALRFSRSIERAGRIYVERLGARAGRVAVPA
ncbi:MAG TPA: hypothetical protein VGP96_13895 [Candidatus Dormibacteraeota bacterium]|jgi:hypothetical protein|nr:hypothetical protein [Candidatus Dormibacteraeota bacterium]